MKAQREGRKVINWYKVFALGIVPVYTFLFASQDSLIAANLSQLGNRPGKHRGFVFWGMLCGIFFYFIFKELFAVSGCQGRMAKGLLLGACACFLLCVLVPFVPEEHPMAALWHNILAQLAALCTAFLSLTVSLHLRKLDRRLFIGALGGWTASMALCMYLVYATGISGLVETMFITLTCIHAFYMLSRSEKLERNQMEGEELVAAIA